MFKLQPLFIMNQLIINLYILFISYLHILTQKPNSKFLSLPVIKFILKSIEESSQKLNSTFTLETQNLQKNNPNFTRTAQKPPRTQLDATPALRRLLLVLHYCRYLIRGYDIFPPSNGTVSDPNPITFWCRSC